MKIIKHFAMFIIILIAAGCIKTQVRSYTDTKYTSYQIESVAILTISKDIGLSSAIEDSLSKMFTEANVVSVKSRDILPPTRGYSEEEIRNAFLSRGITSLIVVYVGGSSQTSQVIGQQTFGRAYTTASGSAYSLGNNAYGNATATTTSSESSFPIVGHKRDTIADTKLYDIASGNVIWTAQSETEAGGSLFMSDTTTGNNLANKIGESLKSKGHLAKSKDS